MIAGVKNEITILFLVDGMSAGGTERQIIELLKGFKRRKYIKTVLGILVKGGELQSEAECSADLILPVRQTSQYDFSLAFSLISLSKKCGADIIHTFGAVSDFAGIIAGKINGIPVIGGSIRNARPRLNQRDRISKFCMRFASWVVANSHAGLNAFDMTNYDSASVIYNGVDLDRFTKITASSQVNGTSLCMVGNFSNKKNQAQLIAVLPELQKTYPALNLVLVGRGCNLEKCKNQTVDLGIQKSVQMITDCNHPEPFIEACEVGVLLSPQGEGFSNVIIEYMALGKPVIASDMGGNRELVQHGVTGYLLENGNSEKLIEYISRLLHKPDLANKMGQAGRQRIQSKFTLDIMIEKYESLYTKVLGNVKGMK